MKIGNKDQDLPQSLDADGSELAGGWWKPLDGSSWISGRVTVVMCCTIAERQNGRIVVIFKEWHLGTNWLEERRQKNHWSGMVMSELWMKGFWQRGKAEMTENNRLNFHQSFISWHDTNKDTDRFYTIRQFGIKGDITCFLWSSFLYCYDVWCLFLLNMVKVPKTWGESM